MNRRVVASMLVGMLVLGTLGGVAATAVSGGSDPAPEASDAGAASATPETWLIEARAVYNTITCLTVEAGEAVEAEDDAAYAAANAEIAVLLDGMPTHPDAEVNVLYQAIAEGHRDIAADADIDGEAAIAAQAQVIALLERVHQIVPPF